MSEGSGVWYVRARGRVIGPFTFGQLVSLRDRGQLARFDEVSEDRRTWSTAASLGQLFPESMAGGELRGYGVAGGEAVDLSARFSSSTIAQQLSSAPADDSPSWYFARDGVQQGPLPFSDIQRMAWSSEIGPGTLVWTSGMHNWAPASSVRELQFPASARAAASSQFSSSGQVVGAGVIANQPARTSGLAIASLVLGIIWLCGLGSLLATIFGGVALNQIARSKGTLEGKGLATAGVILGIIGLSLFLFPVLRAYFAFLSNTLR